MHGSYVNTALAVDEAHRAGYDDAIFLTQDGQVSEASAANIFLVRKGELITPPVTADILEGITRDAVMELAGKEARGMPVIEREVDRTELYAADEVFLSGTGFQIAPVVEVDDRPIGTGSIGPVVERLQELYFKAARGGWEEYADWTVAVEVAEAARGSEILPPFREAFISDIMRFSPHSTTNQGGLRANYPSRSLAGLPAATTHPQAASSIPVFERSREDER